ncbi:MAG: BatD family protein [Candidatus Muiribacteriota bacterium]
MITKKNFIVFIIFFLSSIIYCNEVRLELDHQNVAVNSTFSFRVILSGDFGNISRPQIEEGSFFEILDVSQSRSINVVNFETQVKQEFKYRALALKSGEFSIGPIKVKADGKDFQTEKVQIKIHEKDDIDKVQSENVKVWQEIDGKEYYLGEQINYKIFFAYRNVQLSNIRLEDSEVFSTDFLVGDPVQNEKRENINGLTYNVIELDYEITPLKSGYYEVEDTRIYFEKVKDGSRQSMNFFDDDFFDSFFSASPFAEVERKILIPDPVSFEVKSLPQPPSEFSKAVGDFKISIEKPTENLSQGKAFVLKVRVEGRGSLNNIDKPVYVTDDNFRVSFSSSDNIENQNRNIDNVKIFEYILFPLKHGELKLPEFKLTAFNPEIKDYYTIKSGLHSVNVKKEKGFQAHKGNIDDYSNNEFVTSSEENKKNSSNLRFLIQKDRAGVNEQKRITYMLISGNFILVFLLMGGYIKKNTENMLIKGPKLEIYKVKKKLQKSVKEKRFFEDFSSFYWRGYAFLFEDKNVDLNSETVLEKLYNTFPDDSDVEKLKKIHNEISIKTYASNKKSLTGAQKYFTEIIYLLNSFYSKWEKKK